jgi:hypothetical protein
MPGLMVVELAVGGEVTEDELPPPQALNTSKLMTPNKLDNTARVDSAWTMGRRMFMARLFSSSRHYFIVGRMNTKIPMHQCPATQHRLFDALKSAATVLASLVLLFASHAAHAEWQKVLTYDSGTVYIDDANIKKAGYVRSFWSLLDYKTPQKAQRGAYFVSTRTHMEMDCRKEMVHILQFSMHSGPMLTGEIIDSQGVMREWQTIPPDTPLVPLFKYVCK